MQESNSVDLLYQLRKSILYLNKALMAASVSGEIESQREIKKCIESIKKQISKLRRTSKK